MVFNRLPSAKVTLVRPVQVSKALSAISVTEAGIVTDSTFLPKIEDEPLPMTVTPSGIATLVSLPV